ncbi:MAG: hypothetical protein KGI33_10495 [Thaumarchaeota archaeon]|nr:hypothetical protein [Nitrososphaerota archaeon]
MRNRHAADIASNLMLAINSTVLKALPGVEVESTVDKAGPSDSSFLLHLRREGIWFEFAEIQIRVYEGDSVLSFEVFAELEVQDFLGRTKMESVNIEDLMQRYSSYNPVISHGLVHTLDPAKKGASDGGKTTATRSIKIRFEIFDRDIAEKEDGIYDYDLAEVAEKAVPCVKALYEIHKDAYSGLVVGKDEHFDNGFKPGF